MDKKDEKDIKETFCPACIAVPLAMAGAGASSLGANQSSNYKKRKQILLWGGISTTVLSLIIVIYYVWIKDCKSCR